MGLTPSLAAEFGGKNPIACGSPFMVPGCIYLMLPVSHSAELKSLSVSCFLVRKLDGSLALDF